MDESDIFPIIISIAIILSVSVALIKITAPAMFVCNDLKMIISENLPEGWILEEAGCFTGIKLTENTYMVFTQIAHKEKASSINDVESDYWDCRTNGLCKVNIETGKTDIPNCLTGWYWEKDC